MKLRAWRRAAGAVFILGLGLSLYGCGNFPARPEAPALYDLGLAEAVGASPAVAPAKLEVRAPSWLATPAMQYRLDYRQPAQRQVYAESRWAAAPAELLERRLLQAFSVPPSAAAGCRLRLDLDEFAQVFDSAEGSRAVIVARAELLSPRGENVLARRAFDLREPASTRDARGGVVAFRKAGDELAREIAAWLASVDSGAAEVRSGCRR
ncbi:ABC-type transport auxiliary lipoprotein family protein [Azoarcus sp. DN11]|uniref:ABC-type transport auxiliary lipoprotein family protein n=1 Tax=Azoarcus sp. DN11 TaxID=356837 RepID=UPI0013E3CF83|nr:ABC-type transport auxiliary lipoprotein family protein [Azoarcus sp. DN11]